ncbi:hypothetical protein KIN20_020794 [Parelaphostrongylus tenuis]|uniref:Secreted protein n=1 Tax=Parelaphostrongylus tenuis TaxID=148309 RepID=A0AAD5N3K8_PARTN|nr:hypothetical protein KIN20_020794 [Parelaphostrongylus tenuis]
MKMTRLSTGAFMISLLVLNSTVLGCGVIPAGQSSTRTFTVTRFTLPVAMVYGGANVAAQVFDVIDRQGRSALLPDAVISAILGQLAVNITYEPLECKTVGFNLMEMVMQNERKCIIASNTVTGNCILKQGQAQMRCSTAMAEILPVANYTTISGTLMTTNIIMANWSRTMWQSVVDRAVRMLALGPFRSHFFAATGTVGAN